MLRWVQGEPVVGTMERICAICTVLGRLSARRLGFRKCTFLIAGDFLTGYGQSARVENDDLECGPKEATFDQSENLWQSGKRENTQ